MGNRKKYYRVETFSYEFEDTIGGITGVILAMLAKRVGATSDTTNEEFACMIASSTDLTVRELYNMLVLFKSETAEPLIYEANKENRYCLYTAEEFSQKENVMELLADIMAYDMPHLELIYYEFELPPEVILYEDKYQIVISRTTYDKYCPEEFYTFEIEDYDDYEDFDDEDEER